MGERIMSSFRNSVARTCQPGRAPQPAAALARRPHADPLGHHAHTGRSGLPPM